MRICRCALIAGFTFALLPVSFPAQGQAVQAWEGTIAIPTYELGPADPNPPFPLINTNPVYPYTMLDNLTDQRALKTYRAIYLENKYLKITILPQLGGHVYSVYDKIDDREVLYRNHVVKYGLVGPRGAWISGGMEFSFPFAHTTDTVSTVESVLHHNADGSATALVGAVDWVSNMYWQIALTLRPDTARLDESVTLFNPTAVNHLYLFWTNTAVKATDDLQYIYPMRETISDDPFAIVQSWPVWDGVDQSWYKNDASALAIFARDVQRNYFGIYYHQSNYGVVHVADFRQDPGKKIWTWGTAPHGRIWDHILSDSDGPYNEIQSGRFYTQGYREFMDPQSIEKWTEHWYPVRGLNGGFVEATNRMAVNVTYLAGKPDGPDAVKILVSPVAEIRNATLAVKLGATPLREIGSIHLAPLQPASFTIPIQSTATAKKELSIEIRSAEDEILLRWSAAEPIDGNPNLIGSVGAPLQKPLSITSQTPLEELYLHGVFLQKRGDMPDALKDYDQVLKQDPGYIPALIKEAIYRYEGADFQKAGALLARASRRDNENPTVAYAAGVIYRAEGQLPLAKDALWTSIHYGNSSPTGHSLAAQFVELGEIEIREGNYVEAAGLLERALTYNADDGLALTDLAVAERLGGDSRQAAISSDAALKQTCLLPYALAEQWLDKGGRDEGSSFSGGETAASPATSGSWTRTISSDPQNYIAIASWYHELGAWQSSDAVLHAEIEYLPAQDLSPMVYYYLASNARQEGDAGQAGEYDRKAASLPISQVFPNRITDAAVLMEAVRHNPADAHASYALGNFLFAHGRYDEAADLWLGALEQGFNNPVLLRNLGVYEWRVKKSLAKAAGYYARAIQLSRNDYRLYTDLDSIYEEESNSVGRTTLFRDAPAEVLSQDTVRVRHAILLLEQSKSNQALALLTNHRFKPWEGGVIVHDVFVRASMEEGERALDARQPGQAAQAFRQAMQYPDDLGTGEPAQPDTAEQRYWLGVALEAEGQTAEAISAWESAAAQGESGADGSPVFSALAYEKLGKDEQAGHILGQCIQAATRPGAGANSYFVAGMAEYYSRNLELARKDFEDALQREPLLWEARVALTTVRGGAKIDHKSARKRRVVAE